MGRMAIGFGLALLVVFSVADVEAQTSPRMISVMGVAERSVAPDEAVMNVTIVSEGNELDAVKHQHDTQLRTLYELAGTLKIERKHLKTRYAQISPKYRYQDDKQLFDGYMASTAIEITLSRVEEVADVMQQLVDKGFDRIDGVQYQLGNPRKIEDELLLDALKNAKEKAERLADSMGESLGKPLQITEGAIQRPMPQPVFARAEAAALSMDAAAKSPVAPPAGELSIRAEINASFALE